MTTDAPRTRDDEHTGAEVLLVESFLDALAASELDRAVSMLAEDVEYSNVGLPTIWGRLQVRRALGGLTRPAIGFEVRTHSIAADGPSVLTERTDVITIGRFRAQFWVWGRFDVHDGRITMWRDSFDVVDVTRGMVRGLVGTVVAGLRPALPTREDAPGR